MDKAIANVETKTLIPACSICEDSGLVTVQVEMPGIEKTGLEVSVDGNLLTVSGRREEEQKSGSYLVRERRSGSFRKTFTIDETIDRDKIEAELTNGILTLKLRIKEAAKPKRIAIAG
jgi:HSP20 family protein